MKYLSLQQAMLGMRVIMTDDGLILKSPAGSAHYNLKGRRHTVWGDASFFPEHLRVKDKRKPKCGHVSFGNGEIVAHRADGSVAWRMGKIGEPTKTPDDALGELSAVYTLPRYKISSYMKRQELIANALDEAKQRFSEEFGGVPADKTAVVFLADRWVAVEGGYTPDEIRDAEEYIKRKRKQKADEKAMAESSPYFVKDGQAFIKAAFIGNAIKTSMKLSPEMEKAISDVVSAELKKNLQPGGTIWTSLKRGF
ncbi:hypothetical protein [Enterobacter hormaechei]|uniref:hypothetical protein n=1 Tax=Enterobacter hormaechei TaxID=158836 RepID=UPI000735B38F|nr:MULTISPECIES: hypothetical protein [Enterobacter cloacae complex]EME8864227.1 hypothetical protein [Enterobacter hormaechei]KAA0887135.1 hypothetical protein EYC90_01225 [Enterobacter hormaechei]KAA0895688.1 hypothetical protein EYC89_15285 [Enterobacter hormaechei]KTI40507.1 hypothetical protein ASV05_06680 [Enterobacter hormaechei subsp. xiangfangensis]KTJ84704.1 hypothetical protein ASU73_22030 [Enterobacter hormaechei subsp. xiangfangensis]